jgi:hypothetical protein
MLISNKERAWQKDKFLYLLASGVSNKRLFSSKCGLGNKPNNSLDGLDVVSQPSDTVFSLSSISKLGLKTYENPQESRELIRKDNNGKVGVYC